MVANINWRDILWNDKYQLLKHNIIIFIMLDIVSLFFLSFGELLLYLHKMNFKLRKFENEMVCPRCIGKGYVDADDIKRMGLINQSPADCKYCKSSGHVERGKPIKINPSYLT
jgi:hypothetical protein